MRFVDAQDMFTFLAFSLVATTICVDPGHPSEVGIGTRGKKLTEVAVCWKVALELKKELEHDGYRVVLTKTAERQKVLNKKRAEIANTSGTAFFVRLHCDAGNGTGIETYFPDRQGRVGKMTGPSQDVIRASEAAASKFHPAMIKALGGALRDNGFHSDTKTLIGGKQGALTGSIYSKVPVVLVEMVVLQNPKDEAFFLKAGGYQKMAKALAAGVRAVVPPK